MALTKVTGQGLETLSDGVTISTADNTDTLQLISTDADANIGPNLRLYRNSSSPADSDTIGVIDFEGRNDNSQDIIAARINVLVDDVSDGTEDATLFINTMLAGTVSSRIKMAPNETVLNEDSKDLDFRVESNGNANMLFVDGGNDTMAIGQAATTSATVTIKNKGDSTTNTLDLFNDNGNRTVSMQQDSTGNAKMRFQKNDGTFTTTIDANLGGILFGTDTAAANTLDDYEEGTFTGTLVSSGGGTITLESAGDLCFYTKIGGLVTIGGRLEVASVSSPSGHLQIGGIPFNVIDTGEISALNAVVVNVYSPAANPTGVFGAEMDDNRTHILVRDGFGHTGGVLTAADHIDAGSNVAFTATYRAT